MNSNVRIASELVRMARMLAAADMHSNMVQIHDGNGADALLFVDRNDFPIACAVRGNNDKIRIVTFKSEEDLYFNCMRSDGRNANAFLRKICSICHENEADSTEQSRGTARTRNLFRTAVWNEIVENGIGEEAMRWMKNSEEELPYYDAFNLLYREYRCVEEYFERAFGMPKDSQKRTRKFDESGFNVVVGRDDISDDEIAHMVKEVRASLPQSVAGRLCYGTIRICDDFNGDVVGDYERQTDTIRIASGNKRHIVLYLLHELGHRWLDRIASRKQKTAVKKAYQNALGEELPLEEGDILEFGDGERLEFQYFNRGRMYAKDEGGELWSFKKTILTHIKSINGNPVERYRFPSRYARTNSEEFFAECFSRMCLGTLTDERLESRMREIIESENP